MFFPFQQPGMEELKVSLDEAKAKESSGEGTASKVRHLQQVYKF